MKRQEFASLVAAGLLPEVEAIVVKAHHELHRKEGKPWVPPDAYRWLKYESQAPVDRLADGVRRLNKLGVSCDPRAVEKACRKASQSGFLI